MKNKILFIIGGIVIVSIGLGLIILKNNKIIANNAPNTIIATSTTVNDSGMAPVGVLQIQDIKLPREFDEVSDYASTFNVKTNKGDVTLNKIQQIPNNRGIFKLNNDLYTYKQTQADGMGSFAYLENSDAATFAILESDFSFNLYAKDKNNVYCRGEILVGADADTFSRIDNAMNDKSNYTEKGYIYYKDKNRTYIYGDCDNNGVE